MGFHDCPVCPGQTESLVLAASSLVHVESDSFTVVYLLKDWEPSRADVDVIVQGILDLFARGCVRSVFHVPRRSKVALALAKFTLSLEVERVSIEGTSLYSFFGTV
ncbi:hypothetical protein ACOSP7_011616 [Xanthoceras sorbifolium]